MTGERETEGEGAERGRRVNKDFLFTSLSAVEGPRTRTKTEREREGLFRQNRLMTSEAPSLH